MQGRVKVMFYLPCLGLGGVERVVQNLASYLPETYDILIAGQIVIPGNLLSKTKLPNNVTLLPGFKQKYESDRYIPLFVYDLYKKIIDHRPDVLFTFWHRTNLTTGFALSLLQKHKRPTWVFSVHGESPGYNNSGLINSVKGKLLRYYAATANIHITITNKLVDMCNKYYHGCSFNLMYNPAVGDELIRLAEESVEDDWFNGDNKTILSIGRLDPMKDYKTLICAFKIVSESEKNARLVVFGEGPQRNDLQSLIDTLGLTAKVRLPGFEPNPYKYISKCRIFTLSSSHGEASPMVLSEAMFLSKPIVTTNFFTASDIISNNITGLIANVGDPNDLGLKIMHLLSDAKKSRELGEQAKLSSLERYYIPNSVNKYGNLIERIHP